MLAIRYRIAMVAGLLGTLMAGHCYRGIQAQETDTNTLEYFLKQADLKHFRDGDRLSVLVMIQAETVLFTAQEVTLY